MAMDADYTFELIFIKTCAPQLKWLNKSFLGSVKSIDIFFYDNFKYEMLFIFEEEVYLRQTELNIHLNSEVLILRKSVFTPTVYKWFMVKCQIQIWKHTNGHF